MFNRLYEIENQFNCKAWSVCGNILLVELALYEFISRLSLQRMFLPNTSARFLRLRFCLDIFLFLFQMDNIAQDLRLSKLNQGNLRSMLEELRDRAFSEWKKLENYLDSSRSLSQSIFKQLVEREKEIISREKQLEAKEIQFKKEFESRLKKWHGIEKMSEELLDEIKAKKEHLESFNSLVKKSSKELQVTEEQYNAIQISIKEKEEYDCIEQSISRGHERLVLLEESLQLKLKESQEMWKEFEDVTEMKERCMKELDLKEEQLKVLQESINECEQKIRSEGEKLKSIQNLIVNRSHELKLKEKQLLIIRKLKENNRHSLKRSVDQLADEFEMKKREFESSIELKGKVLESKIEELDLVDRKVKECLEEIVKKGKNFASLRRLVEERFGELELKEREFERRVNEFKLSQNEFESIRKSAELGFKEKTNNLHSVIKIEQLEETHTSSASHQSCMTKGKDLLGLLNQRLKKHDLVCSEIFAVLQASSDPAKLVL